jgi:hypothetical protein
LEYSFSKLPHLQATKLPLKTPPTLFAFCFLLISSHCFGQAQNNPTIQMLKHFYRSYMTEISDDNGRMMEKRLDSIRKEYCTPIFIKRLADDSLDYDPLINAQDADKRWLKTLVIKKDTTKPNRYRVSYSDGYHPTIIHLKVIEDKIDSVW